jgi:hypothetical protein
VDAATGKFGEDQPEGGRGACLWQEQDGKKRLIGYASRQLRKNELNYSAFLLEMQAMVYGMEFFDHYLRPAPFTVYSDHKPLGTLNKTHKRTLDRLNELVSRYSFTIKHVDGHENLVADYLSRSVPFPVDPIDMDPNTLAQLQRKDPIIQQWRQAYDGHDDSKLPFDRQLLEVFNDILFTNSKTRNRSDPNLGRRIIAPTSIRNKIITEAHNSPLGGHMGAFKTKDRVFQQFWWPAMDKDIETFIKNCGPCNAVGNKFPLPHAPQINIPLPAAPNHRVHIDLNGPHRTADGSTKYICVITDAFSKYVSLSAIRNKTAEAVAETLIESWIKNFGVPRLLVSDNGKEFCNKIINDLSTRLAIGRATTAPYHPKRTPRQRPSTRRPTATSPAC